MHIAHVHLCSVQKCRCLPCNVVRDVIVLLLNHALGVRAELFRERGKRAFRVQEGGGGDFIMARHADLARSSTHQENRG